MKRELDADERCPERTETSSRAHDQGAGGLMRAICNGVTIARSDDTMMIEGNHYFPADSVAPECLRRSQMKSLCPWKGLASYYHLEANGQCSTNAAWTYLHPYPWIRKIKNRVAFWNGIEIAPD